MTKRQPGRKHIPKRMCVLCRHKFDKREITRLVSTDDGVFVDLTGKRSGRGAYLCANPACWDAAISRNQLSNALKTTLTIDEKAAILAQKPVALEQISVVK